MASVAYFPAPRRFTPLKSTEIESPRIVPRQFKFAKSGLAANDGVYGIQNDLLDQRLSWTEFFRLLIQSAKFFETLLPSRGGHAGVRRSKTCARRNTRICHLTDGRSA